MICEELGLFGALLTIALYLGIIFVAWQVVRRNRDSFGRLLAFGGYNRQIGTEGAWQGADRVYTDEVIRYEVGVGSWLDICAWLDVVRWARSAFRQEAMYIEVAGIPEIIGSDG